MKGRLSTIVRRVGFVVELLLKKKKQTLVQISEAWMEEQEGNEAISRKMMRSIIEDAIDMFAVHICCELAGSTSFYHIPNDEVLRDSSLYNWCISALSMSKTLLNATEISDRILLTEYVSENGRLAPFVEAMKKNVLVRMSYSKYEAVTTSEHLIAPLCAKVYGGRFYIIGRLENGYWCPFSFDRIDTLEVTDIKFELPRDFYAREYFNYAYGVMVDDRKWPATHVLLRVSHNEALYLNDVPIHHSQTLVEQNEKFSIYSYYLGITNDFIGYLVARCSRVKVLAPPSLAETVRQWHLDAASLYADIV